MEVSTEPRGRRRVGLVAMAAAGPVFVAFALVEGRRRDHYQASRHPISSLSLGPRGWRQRVNFWLTGSACLAGAVALESCRRTTGPGLRSPVGPVLVGTVGAGLIGAGVYPCDPLNGYPPGTPAVPQRTTTGALHDLWSTPVFLALPAAAVIYARAFVRDGRGGWAAASAGAAATQLVTFVLAGVGFNQQPVLVDYAGVLQRASLVSGFGWLTALSTRMLADVAAAG